MLTQTALSDALVSSPEYKALVLKFQKETEAKITKGTYLVKALGVELSVPQIAMHYQAHKGISKFARNPYSEAVSRECHSILKREGISMSLDNIAALAKLAK